MQKNRPAYLLPACCVLVKIDGHFYIVPRWQDFTINGILYKAKVKK